ncbi:MAG: hypothetical protein R3E39_04055 [Anaerolineae bacterium]
MSVWDEDGLLLTGEHKLGQYQLEIVRHTASGWAPTVPPLNALVTNYRLILHPQTRRRYSPASIPNTAITQVTDVMLNHRQGVRIALRDGLRLYVVVSWSQGEELTSTMKVMLTTPLGSGFSESPAHQDIDRIISFIKRL